MTDEELERLTTIEKRIGELAEEFGLRTTEIDFEIVSPQKMMEAMAYMYPTNFSHWSRGRDFERLKTIYDYTGSGLPYEVVWNFKSPRAFLMKTNPFILNVVVMAHVYGHVDFNLRNTFVSRGRELVDIATEARHAVKRFEEYENKYGKERVEKVIEAGLSMQWLQNPNPLAEEMDEDVLRERLLELAQAKLKKARGKNSNFAKKASDNEISQLEINIKKLKFKTPPEPTYDVLGYIIKHSRRLQDWQKDILSVIRTQANSLMKQARTKLLNEGWATYWHTHIMRKLFEEGWFDHEDHEVYTKFHSAVLAENKMGFNWYRIGYGLYEYIKERWDKGQFGPAWEKETNSNKRAQWDTGAMLGAEKLFKVSENLTDRMAIEEFFTDEFIHREQLYVYAEVPNFMRPGESRYVIVEDDPEVIRALLVAQHTSYGAPMISIWDGNYKNNGELYIKHHFTGFELDSIYENGALEYFYFVWGKPVYLETVEIDVDQDMATGERIVEQIPILHIYNGRKHSIQYLENSKLP